jgi:hypothetical protein
VDPDRAEARIAALICKRRVFGDLIEHALIKIVALSRHPGFQLGPSTDGAIHEEIELHVGQSNGDPPA